MYSNVSKNKQFYSFISRLYFSSWSIKPLYGLLSDFVPICGYHRFTYLLITTVINLCAWIALYFVPTEYNYLLIFCVLAAFSLAFNDVLSKHKKTIFVVVFLLRIVNKMIL
jgi:hypothetical protein